MSRVGPAAAALIAAGIASAAMPARGQVVPVAIQPFRARCFDDAKLAERVRARLPPEVPVAVGRAGEGAAHLVRVSVDAAGLTVQVTARSASRRVVGSERRVIPEGGDCAAQLEMAALIVARAATPLSAREAPQPRPPRPEVTQNDPRERVGRNDAREPREPREKVGQNDSHENAGQNDARGSVGRNSPRENVGQNDAGRNDAREPDADEAARRAAAAERDRQRDAELARERARELELVLELERERDARRREKPQLPPEKISRPGPPPIPKRRFELDVLATWIFPLDGGPSTPTGELVAGYSWRRLGFALRAGVSDEWSAGAASSAGPITLFARRVPLAAELHVDFRVRGGCVRLGAGPLVALWAVRSTGLPHPASRVLADPGLTVRAAYRLELAPIVLQFGVTVDFLFRADTLAVDGVGPVARTPLYQVGPFVSFGFQR